MFWLMEPSSGDTSTNFTILNYSFYMDPYIVFINVCYNLKKYSVLLSLLFNHLFLLVRWDFGYYGHYWPIVPAPDDRRW
jgi:hypothetical protein